MDRQLKKELEPMLKPHYNISDSIPITSISDEGIFETRKNLYSKTYHLTDVNFQIAKRVEKGEMFVAYRAFLNSLDPSQTLQITIYNHRIIGSTDADDIILQEMGDGQDYLRQAFNKLIMKNAEAGNNSIKKEKYFTLSQEANDMVASSKNFIIAESELISHISDVPGADLKPLSLFERLNLIRDIYNPGTESSFTEYSYVAGKKIKTFSLENMYRQGMNARELVQPSSMEFYANYFKLGDVYGRALDIEMLPRALKDSFLNDITNVDFDVILSMSIRMLEKGESYKLVDRKLTNSEAEFVAVQHKSGIASHRLKNEQEELEDLMDDISKRDQNLLDVRIHMVIFAESMEQLNEYTKKINSIARSRGVTFVYATDMQEQSLVSTLPFGYDCTGVYRTVNSDAAAGFIPFSAQELISKRTRNSHPCYYGINRVTKSLISYDRFSGDSYNGMIWGFTGSGKSMMAKMIILNTLLTDPDADVIVIDPNDEYKACCEAVNGQVINAIGSGKQRINALEIDKSYGVDGQDPVAEKIDFIQSLVQVMIGQTLPLTAIQKNAIIMCGKQTFEPWLKHGKSDEYVPTLQDFYDILIRRDDVNKVADIYELCQTVERFTEAGVDVILCGRTNVEIYSRFVDYAIGQLGADLKPLMMLVILENIWIRLCRNRRLRRRTYIFIDEVHLLLTSEMVAQYLLKFYKVARKYGGAPTGITQNVEDIISSPAGRGIINNTPFIIMLKQSALDRNALEQLFNLSPTQLSYITNSKPGEGLLYVQSSANLNTTSIIPFKNTIPEDNLIYKLTTTKLGEENIS